MLDAHVRVLYVLPGSLVSTGTINYEPAYQLAILYDCTGTVLYDCPLSLIFHENMVLRS